MTDPFKDLLNGLGSRGAGDEFAERRDRTVEEEIVKFLLKKLNVEHVKKELCSYGQTQFGDGRLRLQSFLARFPSFPIRLEYRGVKGLLKAVNRMSLFNNFVNLPFMPAYSALMDELGPAAEDKALGLVMPWGAMPGGMVLHNCSLDPDNTGVRLVWIHRNKKPKVTQRMVLEPLSSLLRSIAGWTPDD